MSSQGEGIRLCEEAFERLVAGRPEIAEHVGLPTSKITAGVVSVEAGFDRGYLKKNRKSHKPLVARIETVRGEKATSEGLAMEKVRRARNALERAEAEANLAKEQLAAALTQNLMLLGQVRELEYQLSGYQKRLL